jgi:hypothetical protein
MKRGHRTTKELRKINYILKNIEVPPNVDRIRFGRICLQNIVSEQLDQESQDNYQDLYGDSKERISTNYDLGYFNKQ